MAAMRLWGAERLPIVHALVHGVAGAAGLGALLVSVTWSKTAALSVVGFFAAAIGGTVMFFMYHMKRRPLPIPLMSIHAALSMLSYSSFTDAGFMLG